MIFLNIWRTWYLTWYFQWELYKDRLRSISFFYFQSFDEIPENATIWYHPVSNTFITYKRIRREHCNPSNYNGVNLSRSSSLSLSCALAHSVLSILCDTNINKIKEKAFEDLKYQNTSLAYKKYIRYKLLFGNHRKITTARRYEQKDASWYHKYNNQTVMPPMCV